MNIFVELSPEGGHLWIFLFRLCYPGAGKINQLELEGCGKEMAAYRINPLLRLTFSLFPLLGTASAAKAARPGES